MVQSTASWKRRYIADLTLTTFRPEPHLKVNATTCFSASMCAIYVNRRRAQAWSVLAWSAYWQLYFMKRSSLASTYIHTGNIVCHDPETWQNSRKLCLVKSYNRSSSYFQDRHSIPVNYWQSVVTSHIQHANPRIRTNRPIKTEMQILNGSKLVSTKPVNN